jgi:hypothetical protein
VSSSADCHADGRVAARPSITDVPVSLWVYGLLRSLAFMAPSLTEEGRFGLGAIVTVVLFVFVLRRSHRAYQVLIFLDAFSLVMLLATWLGADDAPLSVPLLAGLALVALLWPSTRRYVSSGPRPAPSDQRTMGGN